MNFVVLVTRLNEGPERIMLARELSTNTDLIVLIIGVEESHLISYAICAQ